MEILIGIAVICGIAIVVYCLAAFVWSSTRIETSPRITFNAFRKLYAISPSKWYLCWDNVSYYADDDWMGIEFTHYVDVIRYRLFRDKVECDKAYLTLTQNEKDFLASVQKDIDAYREQNLNEMRGILEK